MSGNKKIWKENTCRHINYEQNALPTADIITQNALKSYQSGNMGYMEFSNGLNRALTIRTNYLTILHQYNQAIIAIEFLIGNNE